MKKRLVLILSLLCVLSLFGCNEAREEEATTETIPEVTAPRYSAEEQQILDDRRQTVVAQMREMMTFLWRSDVDITYSKQRNSNGIENDDPKNVFTLKAGRVYAGLPYTHGCGSAYDFQAFATDVDEKGIYNISGMTGAALTGVDEMTENRRSRVGNDCSDAVLWAWSKISPSVDFIATYEITEAHGCIKVGEFACDAEKHSMTKDVCISNGADTMFAAYAQLQPGDAVVHNNGAESHAMLVSGVNIVRKEDGTPDYMKSYITVIHQTSGALFNGKYYFDETIGEKVYYCGGVDDVYEFYTLFGSGYLPFTCKELIDPAPIEEERVYDLEPAPTLETIAYGIISSNFAISNLTLTIYDEVGNEVQSSTCFATEVELKNFNMSHFIDEMEKEVAVGNFDPEALPAGTYRCTLECLLSTGNTHLVRDYTFTK